MSSDRRAPGLSPHSPAVGRGPRESDRGGFGGPRWGIESLRSDDIAADPVEETGIPFGSRGWRRDADVAGETPDVAEDESESSSGRRRRSNEGPSHPRRTVAALGSAVEISRDATGVPHLFAKKERDAYAALGYCMAEDRLWQMDLYRRLATGRSAEILGARTARQDALVRTAGIGRRAAAASSRIDGVGRDLLAAFAGGVNAARANGQPEECIRLGYQVEPWTVADSLAIELYLAWETGLATWHDKLLLARVLSTVSVERARWIFPAALDASLATDDRMKIWRRIDPRVPALVEACSEASPVGNAIAVGPSRSTSGAALIASDVQLPAGFPAPMYLVHMEAPGFSVVGAAHVGIPALWIGRNEECAWSGTAAATDDADCVLEELDGIGNFRGESGWSKLNRRHEVVRVREGDSLRISVDETRNGPLVSSLVEQLDGAAESRPISVALRWGVNSLGSSVPGWLAVARAKNLAEIQAAARLLDRAPLSVHLVAADASGSIGRLTAGGRAVRDASSRLPVRGWKSEGRWTAVGTLSGAGCRRDGDCAVAADQDPGAPSANGSVPNDPSAYRFRRIVERLEAGSVHSTESLVAIQADVRDLAAADLLPSVRRALAHPDAASFPQIGQVRPLLESWEGDATASSSAAAVFYTSVAGHLLPALFPEARFGLLARRLDVAWPAAVRILSADSSPWFPDEAAKAQLIARAFSEGATRLANEIGSDSEAWQWGAIHPASMEHPLAHEGLASGVTPTPSAGSLFTVSGHGFIAKEPPFTVTTRPAARMIVDLGNRAVRIGIATGESGIRDSVNSLDQVESFRSGALLDIPRGPRTGAITLELVPG